MRPKRRPILAAVLIGFCAAASQVGAAPGDLDPSFGGDGRVVRALGPEGSGSALADVLIRRGRIDVAGNVDPTRASGDRRFLIARFERSGGLDKGFSRDGVAIAKFPGFGNSDAVSVAPAGGGKRLAVGYKGFSDHSGEHHWDLALARYQENGRLDESFAGGKRVLSLPGRSLIARAAVVQPDGRIVIVGQTAEQVDEAPVSGFVARLESDGDWDPSFGTAGLVIPTAGDFADLGEFNDVRVRYDGAMVAVGGTGGIGSDFAVARFDSSGIPDPGFSGDGIVWTDFGGQTDQAEAVELVDGDVLVAGEADFDESAPSGRFGLARYNPNGTLDPLFSGDGLQTTNFSPRLDNALDVTTWGGRIIAVGTARKRKQGQQPRDDIAVARYRGNGEIDTRFAGDGKRTIDVRGWDLAAAVAGDGDRAVLVGGADASSRRPHGKARAVLVRLRQR